MARVTVNTLGPSQSLIFRITHCDNVPWVLDHGLHCQSSPARDPTFVPIGMADLIAKRQRRTVPLGPGGTLADYVPFYFTPSSIMLFNITTGRNRVIQRPNAEIAVLVSSLPMLTQASVPFVFTNGHAYAQESDYFDDPADVGQIDWDLLRRRDFKADADDPGKLGRYQAEALAYRQVPINALLGLACFNEAACTLLAAAVDRRGLSLPVQVRPDWYF